MPTSDTFAALGQEPPQEGAAGGARPGAARRDDVDRRHRIHDGRDQDKPGDAPGVPARLVPLGDHHVHSVGRVVPRLLHVAAEGHHFHAEPVGLGRDGARVAEAGDEDGYPLLEGHVDRAAHGIREAVHLLAGGAHGGEEHVHTEGLVGGIPHPADLLTQPLGGVVRRRQHAETACLGHGRRQPRACHEAHARLADRVADAEEIAEGGVERAPGPGRHGVSPQA